MLKRQLFIFFIIFVHASSCVVDMLYHIAGEVQTFHSLLDKVDFRCRSDFAGHEYPSYGELKNQLDNIHEQLDEMESSMSSKIILSLANKLNARPLVMRALDILNLYVTSIDDDYRRFDESVFKNQLEKLSISVFPNIESNILIIREIMAEPEKFIPNERNLVAAIINTVKLGKMCGASQLVSEVLIQLFRIVMIAEIKTYVMMGFSNKYRYTKSQGLERINNVASRQFRMFFAGYVDILTQYLEKTENLYLRACDPDDGQWSLNNNYFEFKGAISPIIFRYSMVDCTSLTCDAIPFEFLRRCHPSYYEEWHECPHMPTNCVALGSVEACVLLDSPQRLQYINSTVLGLLGSNFTCPSNNSLITNDESLFYFKYSSCSCDCYGNSSKISLSITKSKVGLNKVITGLRFIRKNNILHIQIKEGTLEAQGYINSTSNKWRSIPSEVDPSQVHPIDEENKIFFLDDLHLPQQYVLTGIKFNKVTRGTVRGFEIEISGVMFNYTTGTLNPQNRIKLSVFTNVPGQPLVIEPVSSAETILPHEPSSEKQTYIKLQRSLLIHDLGKTTLPLVDAVPVTTNPPSALQGMGIFHKGVEGYAGFISLRIYGIKYKKYFDDFISAHILGSMVMFN